MLNETRDLSVKKSLCLNLIFLTIFLTSVKVTLQEVSNNSGVYALPEISLKLKNGTILQTAANSPVKLSQEVGSIQMTCTADYPVKWEYLVNNKTIPILDVVYRRLHNISDFDNPKKNRFMSIVNLHGLLQSQTGKYLCRLYNDRNSNNSYAIASYFEIFIPGNRTFNTISSVSFMNKTAPYVNVHCPVTDPELHVRLYKLNDQHFNKSGVLAWRPVYANYEATDGFRLFAGLGRELLGIYNCTAPLHTGASLIQIFADPSEREHYLSLSQSISIPINSSCRENYKLVQYIRSRRLECYCRDSFGLFMNDNFDFENRQANCSSDGLSLLLNQIANCSDWRLDEFIKSQESSLNVCFWDVTETTSKSQQTVDAVIDGTGSRPSLKVRGKLFPNGDDYRNFPFTKFTSVTYNGFVDWAGDFMLAVCRKDFCVFKNNYRGDNNTDLEYIEKEPTRRQYFPMAHYQAEWMDLFINGTDIKSVYVFQAHSLSYAWFPYSTAKIEWERENSSFSLDMDSSPFDMGAVPSSCSTLKNVKILCYINCVLSTVIFVFTSFAYFSKQ